MEEYTVTQLSNVIKETLEGGGALRDISVCGEISNYSKAKNQFCYLSLKEGKSILKCVIFPGTADSLMFTPENGMQVIARGRIAVYTGGGYYQLQIKSLKSKGVGDLWLANEKTKKRLSEEGLFSDKHKKSLPRFPKNIVLVTSSEGEAVQDMKRILGERWPLSKVIILPVSVQGVHAPGEIAGAIRRANEDQLGDVMIVGRGGGSAEDLDAFNQEEVVRAIYESRIPIISAVGHEGDNTISDKAADVAASTPSRAAELAVLNRKDVYEDLHHLEQRLLQAARRILSEHRTMMAQYERRTFLQDPTAIISERREFLKRRENWMATAFQEQLTEDRRQTAQISAGLKSSAHDYMSRKQENLSEISAHFKDAPNLKVKEERLKMERLAATLDAVSPLKVLGRGYAVARKPDGSVLTSVNMCTADMPFQLCLTDGEVPCRVEETADQNRKECV